ncbi:MAG: hypothetical protein QM813_21110 [Verrucomicrobiota bacterium]
MKRAVAFILSLTVIWLQMMASAQTLFAAPPPPTDPCPCCVAKKVCCCVEESDTQSVPVPIAPATVRANVDFTAVLPQRVAWLLPISALAKATSAEISSASFPAVPLFQRDCALLI